MRVGQGWLTCASQGGLGLSKEALDQLLKRLSEGKAFSSKVSRIDAAEKNVEAIRQVIIELCFFF